MSVWESICLRVFALYDISEDKYFPVQNVKTRFIDFYFMAFGSLMHVNDENNITHR